MARGRLNGLAGLGHGADLVGLDQDRIAGAQGGAFIDLPGVGDKKIIANNLQAVAQALGHGAHALDVVLGKAVLH